jgi:gas vesicle protein
MMMIEDFKTDINNSLKEIQENTGKQVKALKEETQNSLKEVSERSREMAQQLRALTALPEVLIQPLATTSWLTTIYNGI